jgi:uncharacterized membrane protein SpoIIM required for sporulation
MDELARLEVLLGNAERLRLRGLAFDDLRELGRLYRVAASRLARLRARGDDPEAIHYLNALCVRAFGLLYTRHPDGRSRGRLLRRIAHALARTWRAQVLAWALLAAGTLIGGVLASRDDEALYALVPESLGYQGLSLERLARSPEARADFLARDPLSFGHGALFGSSLFAHNTQVGLLSFATGILAGVPTVLLQTYNGLVLGAFASIFLRDPWPVPFAAWLLPHAIPELTALTLCAAAGLVLGAAVAVPGAGGRARALRDAVDPALLLFAASIPLFAVAAVVEGFVRESALGTAPRLALAAGFAGLILLELLSLRHLDRRRPRDVRWLAELIAPPRSDRPGIGSGPAP